MSKTPSQGKAGDRQQAAIGPFTIYTIKHSHPHTNTQAVQGLFVILGKPLILIGISFGRTRPEPSLSILFTPRLQGEIPIRVLVLCVYPPVDPQEQNRCSSHFMTGKLTHPLSIPSIIFYILYFILNLIFIFIYFILHSYLYFYFFSLKLCFRVIIFMLPPPKN